MYETPSDHEMLRNFSTASSQTNRSVMPYHPSRPVTHDALFFSLLPSEALVDSQGYETLNSEVKELKRGSAVLGIRGYTD